MSQLLHKKQNSAESKFALQGKRILLVLNDPGNFFSHREPLARVLLDEGVDLHVIAPPSRLDRLFRNYGVTYHPFSLSQWGMNPVRDLQSMRELRNIYRQLAPDIIHHFTIKPVLYGSLAARGLPSRVINTITGLGYIFLSEGKRARFRRQLVKNWYRIANNSADYVIFQNDADATFFVKETMCRSAISSVIPGSGVYSDAFSSLPFPTSGPIKILLPARLLKEKGIYEFAAAARSLKREFPEVQFILAGQSVSECPSAIASADLKGWQDEGILSYIGFVPSVTEMLRNVHIVCLPSYREGLARSLVEAAAAGRVLVASDTPGCRELVEPGVSGVLVKPGSAESLEEGLRSCLKRKELLPLMGAAARSFFLESEFTSERIQQGYLGVYSSVLKG